MLKWGHIYKSIVNYCVEQNKMDLYVVASFDRQQVSVAFIVVDNRSIYLRFLPFYALMMNV